MLNNQQTTSSVWENAHHSRDRRGSEASYQKRTAFFVELESSQADATLRRQLGFEEESRRYEQLGIERRGDKCVLSRRRVPAVVYLGAVLYPVWIICFMYLFHLGVGLVLIPIFIIILIRIAGNDSELQYLRLARIAYTGKCPSCRYTILPVEQLRSFQKGPTDVPICPECGTLYPLVPPQIKDSAK